MSDIILKEYVKVPDGRTMKVSLFYTLGGINYWSGGTNKRGYVLSVTPVEVEIKEDGRIGIESFTLGSGIKHTLLECNRQSKKREAEAIAMIPDWKQKLIDHVVNSDSVFDRRSKERIAENAMQTVQ